MTKKKRDEKLKQFEDNRSEINSLAVDIHMVFLRLTALMGVKTDSNYIAGKYLPAMDTEHGIQEGEEFIIVGIELMTSDKGTQRPHFRLLSQAGNCSVVTIENFWKVVK